MLKGRESLIRLVGRRRRFLPNRESIFESVKDSLVISGDDNNFTVSGPEEESPAVSDWVNCPVCGSRFRGGDDVINSHLDICLKRGAKRKLSQPTLFQLNFCSRFDNGSHLHKLDDFKDIADRKQSYANVECDTVLESNGSCSAMESNVVPSSSFSYYSSRETMPSDNFSSNADCSVSPNDEIQDHKSTIKDGDDILSLQTFIVGRRFSNEVEPNTGETIKLVRDPNNAKDCNAIKVLTAKPGCDEFLGFLPRELAQYLSPIMDKYSFIFQGCITAKPASLSDNVPVQITCQKCACDTQDSGVVQVFESLWRSACSVAETAQNHIPKYLHNFMLLMEEVLKCYAYLFSSHEKSFLEKFFSLSDDSQKLFIRLYTRKGPWFRILHISYPEISDYAHAVKELSGAGYFCLVESIKELQDDHLKGILNVLTVSELREIFHACKKKCSSGKRKQDLIELLLASHADGSCPPLLEVVLGKVGSCVQISSLAESLIWRAERLFFLNGEQDLSAFLLVDLGIIKYPTYNCIITDQVISSRADFLSFEEAIEVAQIIDESLDENNSKLVLRCIEISDSRITTNCPNSISELKLTWVTYFKAPWIYSKVVLLGVSFLERERRYSEATNLLKRLLLNFTSDRRRGYWTLRLSIDLEHLGYVDESLSVAEDGIQDPWVRAGSKMTLQRRILRLGKPPRRWKTPNFAVTVNRKIDEVHVQGRPLNCKTGTKSRFYGEDGEQCSVESLALQYYATEGGGGWTGVHTESGIWLNIFGLLLWDAIFADIPDVFRTKFQTAPLDFDSDSFYEVRKIMIEQQLEKIKDGMAEEILITSWDSHEGTACRGVNWERNSLAELRAAVTCVGGRCVSSICRHLAQDYRSWSSGMPDLLLWRFKGEYSGEAKIVEVKGPRDRLSEQQRAWLLFLMDCGFNVEVCKVGHALEAS